jgi:multiple sugar transport system substrate-binding protein
MASVQGQVVLTFPAERTMTATLRVASFPSLDRSVHAILPHWRVRHPDVAIELSTRRVREHHDAMATALGDAAAPVPDVIGIDVEQLGRLMALGLVELDRSPYQVDQQTHRLVSWAVQQARNASGRTQVVPADIGPATLFYRADLMEKAGIAEADLTGGWESFIDAGRRLKAATGAAILAHPCYLKDVYIRANLEPGEGVYFSAQGEPLLRSPRFAEAFRLALAARAAGIDAGIAPGWTDAWTERIRAGAIAAQPTGSWFGAHLTSWLAPEARGLWRCCEVPGGRAAAWGGSFYGIPRRAAHKDLAFDFIRLACFEPDVQRHCLHQLHAFPALLEVQDDPIIDEPMPFLRGQAARQQWKRTAASVRAGPVHPLDPVADQAVTEELNRVLEGGKSPEEALADAERTVRGHGAPR